MLFAYQKRPADAEAALRPAINAFKNADGELLNTPESRTVDKLMGEVLATQGKYEEAVRHLLRADTIAKDAVKTASGSEVVATLGARLKCLEKLGMCYLSLARDHLARPCFEEGAAIARQLNDKAQLQVLEQYLHQCQQ
jgi:tetratricopeptide (TPR) repeat protein